MWNSIKEWVYKHPWYTFWILLFLIVTLLIIAAIIVLFFIWLFTPKSNTKIETIKDLNKPEITKDLNEPETTKDLNEIYNIVKYKLRNNIIRFTEKIEIIFHLNIDIANIESITIIMDDIPNVKNIIYLIGKSKIDFDKFIEIIKKFIVETITVKYDNINKNIRIQSNNINIIRKNISNSKTEKDLIDYILFILYTNLGYYVAYNNNSNSMFLNSGNTNLNIKNLYISDKKYKNISTKNITFIKYIIDLIKKDNIKFLSKLII